jgi:hypothetical protein
MTGMIDAEDNDPIMDELDKDDKAYHERKDDIESDFKEGDINTKKE